MRGLVALAVYGLVEIALAVEQADGDEGQAHVCLLYTSDAADERSSVDLGGRRILNKKKSSGIGWYVCMWKNIE